MILFIFEGDDREPNLYKTMDRLYFPRDNTNIVCSFGNNIYALYDDLKDLGGDGDIVAVLKEQLNKRGDTTLDGKRSSDFSEIYLFFDYDFQHKFLTLDEINSRLEEMFLMFNEETMNGKLYINYPMVESIRYSKELPDEQYVKYIVSREDCRDFKRLANDFSPYANLDYILFKEGESPSHERYQTIKDNWQYLKTMNVSKANYIVNGKYEVPIQKSDINQEAIFAWQRKKYIDPSESVAVLNSFPLFLYEYLK